VHLTRSQALPGKADPEALPPLENREAEPQEMRSQVEPGNEKREKLHLKSDGGECAHRQMLLPSKQLNPIAIRTKTTNQPSQHCQQYREYPEQLR